MGIDVFERYARATREAFAADLGCPVEAFDGEQLVIVDRPFENNWYTLRGGTFGTGTVLSLDPEYRAFIEANPPKRHYSALSGAYLGSIVAEGRRRGHTMDLHPPSLCFTLAQELEDGPLPDGFEVRRHDADWMNAEQASLRFGSPRFENAVGEPGRDRRELRNRFALVLYERGEPVAAAGAFDTHGMLEIGIDVNRAHRGSRLGRAMVLRITRAIIDEGKVPFYSCGPANVRSHRTAESSGFRTVCSRAFVSAPL